MDPKQWKAYREERYLESMFGGKVSNEKFGTTL